MQIAHTVSQLQFAKQVLQEEGVASLGKLRLQVKLKGVLFSSSRKLSTDTSKLSLLRRG